MQQIIGLLGVKGGGKDTTAAFLVKYAGFKRIGFADALYREAADAFGVTTQFLGNRETKETPLQQLSLRNCTDTAFVECVVEELNMLAWWKRLARTFGLRCHHLDEPLSPRVVMQLWGTEYRRRRGVDSYWLDKVLAAIQAEPDQPFVVTDVRFLNEFNFIHRLGGILVRIRRPDLEAKEAIERAKRGTASHSSETELLHVAADSELFNEEGNPESLRAGILALAEEPVAA